MTLVRGPLGCNVPCRSSALRVLGANEAEKGNVGFGSCDSESVRSSRQQTVLEFLRFCDPSSQSHTRITPRLKQIDQSHLCCRSWSH